MERTFDVAESVRITDPEDRSSSDSDSGDDCRADSSRTDPGHDLNRNARHKISKFRPIADKALNAVYCLFDRGPNMLAQPC